MAASEAPRIAVTMGDPAGIGPEIIVKVLSQRGTFHFCRPIVLGDRNMIERAVRLLGSTIEVHEMETAGEQHYRHGALNLVPLSAIRPEEAGYGAPSRRAGGQCMPILPKLCGWPCGVRWTPLPPHPSARRRSLTRDIPTRPHRTAGRAYRDRRYVMMLAGEKLKVVPVTIHCALRDVFRLLTTDKIVTAIRITHRALQEYFRLPQPRIAVAALNPHAGEGGLFGNEEEKIIVPALEQSRALGIDVQVPCRRTPFFIMPQRAVTMQ